METWAALAHQSRRRARAHKVGCEVEVAGSFGGLLDAGHLLQSMVARGCR